MSQVADLRTLQELDDEAAGLRATLDDVERRLKGSEELETARAGLSAIDERLAETRRNQRRLDGEIGVLSSRIAPEEKRLYDGSVRNPKELGNIQHELELLKAQRGGLEDELLEVMTALEGLEADHKRARKAVANAETRWEAESASLQIEAERLAGLLIRADARREAQRLTISARALHVYDDIRRRKGGVAVSHIQGSMCSGCRVSVPESVRRSAFQPDQLAQCPNCERILYVG